MKPIFPIVMLATGILIFQATLQHYLPVSPSTATVKKQHIGTNKSFF